MSKHVLCPECQSENIAGSKFCNHCGARLPKSTSILCPKCQTPNPHNNFYCDNCGGRLHAEQTPNVPEEPIPEASDLPTSAKMFSLPTRQPGDTGELDADSLPDWLKTHSDPSEKQEITGKLPRLSDLTPEERDTADDLPGWLIDTENENLLIGSPDDITTEHFLHLIQDINEEERQKLSGILSDPNITGESANLPDWLKGVVQPKTTQPSSKPPAEPGKPNKTAVDADEVDWLSALTTTPPQNTPVPDSFAADDDMESDELPDWLGEIGPPKTALLGQADEHGSSPAFDDDEADDLPDWLTAEPARTKEPTMPQTTSGMFTDETADDDFSFVEDDELDWTLDATAKQTDDTPAPEAADDLLLNAAAATSLTGWLSEFDMDDEAEETAVSSPEPPLAETSTSQRSLTDWLTAFDEEDLIPDDQTTAAAESLPDWLTGATTTPPAQTEADDSFADTEEEADWLEMDITTDTSLASGNTGILPDWFDELGDMAEPSASLDSSELDSTLDNLFGEKPKDATGELEWLSAVEDKPETEAKADDTNWAPLVGALRATAIAGALSQDDDDDEADSGFLDDDPDWLSEFTRFDTSELPEIVDRETAVSPTSDTENEDEFDFDISAILDATESGAQDDFDIDDALLGIEAKSTGDWTDIDGILAGNSDDDTLPDWLEQLDDFDEKEAAFAQTDKAPSEEIPDWVANLRPGDTGQLSSVLPSAMFTDSDASEFLDDNEDLADAELPDWLDASMTPRVAKADKEAALWFDNEGGMDDTELEAILADLPPAQAPEDMLLKAEIPDWLEELKPRELTGAAQPLTESRLESSGPLAGMPNTIAIEPIIAMPRAITSPRAYTVSPEQMQQARLLRQLVQEGPQPRPAPKPVISARSLTGLRIGVAVLILAAVLLGLYGPTFLKSVAPVAVPAPAAALNTAVSKAAGKPVLVAFEYSPALAGELDIAAETLLAQLQANSSPVIVTSQYVAGTAVAEQTTAPYDVTLLGFIPGEAMGLRQLGDCLGANAVVAPCTHLHNLTLTDDLATALADVSLVIVLTGERSSLVNWVEQVGVSSDVPIVIGATQALESVVVPYYASAQIDGYLDSLPTTMSYQQTYTPLTDIAANAIYGAQSLVLLVTAVILLLGGLIIGFGKKNS